MAGPNIRYRIEVMHEGRWSAWGLAPTLAMAEIKADEAHDETAGRDVRIVPFRSRRS